MLRRLRPLLACVPLVLTPARAAIPAEPLDVVVYGGTVAGIAAAVQAARQGASVVLLEPGPALGGMTAGGLGAADVGDKRAVGGLAREFFGRVHAHYRDPRAWRQETRADYLPRHPLNVTEATGQHWFFEPHVASRILEDLLREAGVKAHLGARLDRAGGVDRNGPRLTALRLLDGRSFRGRTFIDATYEGDLLAAAGVSHRTGREANREYGETLNGVRSLPPERTAGIDPFVEPGHPASGLLPGVAPRAPGPEGEADASVQAYTFRVCLTDVPGNRVALTRPENYDARQHELVLRFIAGRPLLPGPRLFTLTPMPNRKTDTNNRDLFSTDLIGGATGWAEAGYEERERRWREHRDHVQGLLWFLAHDPRVPATTRAEVARWGLARDEFAATGHWPFQLYVREARRMSGEYVITENDARRRTTVPDPVAFASYALDSHVVGFYADEQGRLRVEGHFLENIRAFPLSYRALLPRRAEADNLLVPVCLSSTHAAYGSIRMEPVFLMLGQAAGAAAVLAREHGGSPHAVPYARLREVLVGAGAVLELARAEAAARGPVGAADPAALAAVDALHARGHFAPAEASLNAWRNAVRPGATIEAARARALLVSVAARAAPEVTEPGAALGLLARRGVRLGTDWAALTDPAAEAGGTAVSELVVALAALAP